MGNALILEPKAISSITPSNTASGYSGSNMALDLMGLVWKSDTGSATRNVIFDLGSDTAVDTIVLVGLNGALQAWNWSIDLATSAQGAFTGSFFAGSSRTLLAGTNSPTSGLGKALWLASSETSPPATSRYVRVNFSNLGTAAVEVSRAIIGSAIQPGINFAYGAGFGVRSMGNVDFSNTGVPLVRNGARLRGLAISFDAATEAEVQTSIQPMLERLGNDNTICVVTDPDANADRQNRIYFGFLTGDLGTIWARLGGFQAKFNLVALD